MYAYNSFLFDIYLSFSGSECQALLSPRLKELILDSLKYIYNDKEPRIKDKAIQLKKQITHESSWDKI